MHHPVDLPAQLHGPLFPVIDARGQVLYRTAVIRETVDHQQRILLRTPSWGSPTATASHHNRGIARAFQRRREGELVYPSLDQVRDRVLRQQVAACRGFYLHVLTTSRKESSIASGKRSMFATTAGVMKSWVPPRRNS